MIQSYHNGSHFILTPNLNSLKGPEILGDGFRYVADD